MAAKMELGGVFIRSGLTVTTVIRIEIESVKSWLPERNQKRIADWTPEEVEKERAAIEQAVANFLLRQ